MLGAGAIDLALVAGLVAAAKRRGARAAPGFAVLAGLLALTTVSAIVLATLAVTIGLSLGALLISMLAGSAALLVVALVGRSAVGRAPLQVGPAITTPKAIALGVFYGVTGAVRVLALITLVVAVFDLPLQTASEAFGLERSWGVLGIGLFVLAAVVLAPLAEEVLFRGVLLPWLARWMRPAAAMAWTTIVFALGHLYYGVGAILIAHYGLVFGWARLRTGRLVAPIALHAILNGTTVLALLAASSSAG
jgi:membrane protease YdiL (CAAX protease family)